MATSFFDKALNQAPMGLQSDGLVMEPDIEIEIEDPESVSVGLADKPLFFSHLIFGHTVDCTCHFFVHVLFLGKGFNQVILLRQPCKHPCLNLR